MGIQAIKKHMNRETHKKFSRNVQKTRTINSFFSTSQPSSFSTTIIMPSADVACAEIVWALTVA